MLGTPSKREILESLQINPKHPPPLRKAVGENFWVKKLKKGQNVAALKTPLKIRSRQTDRLGAIIKPFNWHFKCVSFGGVSQRSRKPSIVPKIWFSDLRQTIISSFQKSA